MTAAPVGEVRCEKSGSGQLKRLIIAGHAGLTWHYKQPRKEGIELIAPEQLIELKQTPVLQTSVDRGANQRSARRALPICGLTYVPANSLQSVPPLRPLLTYRLRNYL